MIENERKQRKSEAFFGRRQGKPLRETQEERRQTLLPRLKIDLEQPAPADPALLFSEPVENIRLEIGFGGGEHLLHEAQQYTATGFIGVEPFVNGMAKLLAGLENNEALQTRLRLYDDDATALLDWLPEKSISHIDLLYPDPWPKKKHWKRRFVNQKNLSRFARILKPGGKFCFASDIDTYINWTLNHCDQHPDFIWPATSAADWHTPYPLWPGTRYEAKALREGRAPCYLTFIRA